jgi:hypothetical protein
MDKYLKSARGRPFYRKRAPIRCGYIHSYLDASAAIERYINHSPCSRTFEIASPDREVVNKATLEGRRFRNIVALRAYPSLGELYNKYYDIYEPILQLNLKASSVHQGINRRNSRSKIPFYNIPPRVLMYARSHLTSPSSNSNWSIGSTRDGALQRDLVCA